MLAVVLVLSALACGSTLAEEKPIGLVQYPSDKCTGDVICPSNFLYYFACCADECCLRLQPIPAVILGVFAGLVGVGIVYAVCCFICCPKP